jgi:hypothetical protein
MIDISPTDIVLTRQATNGRFVIFTRTDVRPTWPLRWWGVVADTGGDAFGLLVRLNGLAAPEGWTARQLLAVARARAAAEYERSATAPAVAALECLDKAVAAIGKPAWPTEADAPVEFERGDPQSPYAWTVARCGAFWLPLCPDPLGTGDGIAPEQVLIVLDQLLLNATRAFPHSRALWTTRRQVAGALAAEVRRAAEAD